MLNLLHKVQVGVVLDGQELRAVKVVAYKKRWQVVASLRFAWDPDDVPASSLVLKNFCGWPLTKIIGGLFLQRVLQKNILVDARLGPAEILNYLQTQAGSLLGDAFENLAVDFYCSESAAAQKKLHMVATPKVALTYLQPVLHSYPERKQVVDLVSIGILRTLIYLQLNLAEVNGVYFFYQTHILFLVIQAKQIIFTYVIECVVRAELDQTILLALQRALQWAQRQTNFSAIKNIYFLSSVVVDSAWLTIATEFLKIPVLVVNAKVDKMDPVALDPFIDCVGLALWGMHVRD